MKSFFAVRCTLALLALTPFVPAQDKTAAHPPLLLVVNQGDQSLSIIDADAGRELAKVKTNGVRAHEVAASLDGRFAYLPIYGNAGVGRPGTDGRSIEIVDLEKRSVVETIDLGRPVRPHCAKFAPDGMLYVSAELDQAVDVIDPHTRKRVASIPTGQLESHMLAITRDGRRAYTSNVGPGSVSVLDLAGKKTIKVIPVAKTNQRISLSVDDRYAFTADQDQPRLAVIDTAKNEVSQWIALPSVGYASTPTADGRWLLVALQGASQVAVVDLSQMKVTRTIDVPAVPAQILVRPDRPLAYISCLKAGKVAPLDLNNWQVVKVIDAGAGADGMGWVKGQ